MAAWEIFRWCSRSTVPRIQLDHANFERWWIVNVRSLFKNIAPKGKKTHTTTMSMTYPPWNQQVVPENMPKPKMRLVFQPSIFKCQPVGFRECRLRPSDVWVKNHGFVVHFLDIWHVSNATLWLQPWCNFWTWRYFHVAHVSHDIFLKLLETWQFWGLEQRHAEVQVVFFGDLVEDMSGWCLITGKKARCRFFTGEERQITLEWPMTSCQPIG